MIIIRYIITCTRVCEKLRSLLHNLQIHVLSAMFLYRDQMTVKTHIQLNLRKLVI